MTANTKPQSIAW